MSGSAPPLTEFLRPGLLAGDIPALYPLLAGRALIDACVAVFRGGDEEVLVRLLVLREIGGRADAPQWSPRELELHFSFIDPVKLDTVLKRLREHSLLVWDSDTRLYTLSPTGRMVLSALATLLNFSNEDDAGLGFLAGQIAAGDAVGRIAPETLSHLLARLAELEDEFEQAVASGSEFRLRTAQTRLASVAQWMDKGNEILQRLSVDGFANDASWRIAQEIGHRQSRIMRMTSVFQRELAAIARQRVHLSQGGLSSSELAAWLKDMDIERLTALAGDAPAVVPASCFILPDVMLDNAEAFVEREQPQRRVSQLPSPVEIMQTADIPLELPPQLAALTRLLAQLDGEMTVADAVVGDSFSAASYRLSLLAFLGERNIDPDLAPLAELPLTLHWDDALQTIGSNEISAITAGRLMPINSTPHSTEN